MKLFLSAIVGVVSAIHVAEKSPLTAAEKQAVGNALTGALQTLKGNSKGGSKLASCMSLFPNKVQGKESDALWASCKNEFASAGLMQKQTKVVNMADMTKGTEEPVKKEYNAEEYSADWGTEHKSEDYPDKAEGLQHHPEYGSAAGNSVAVAFATVAAGALLM